MRPIVARPDGELEVLGGFRPAARSGGRVLKLDASAVIPLPEGTTLMHLPGRRALALDSKDRPVDVEADLLPVAAVLPVGHLRTLLPASRPLPGSKRLPLYGYAAVVEHHDELMVAALSTDAFGWWEPRRYAGGGLDAAIENARQALPGNRLVDHLAICATDLRCYTAQNTFLRRYEGALPASPACNADCLGCISLQTDSGAPTPQPRIPRAPTAEDLIEVGSYHLNGAEARGEAGMLSFGQGCEGEPLLRERALRPVAVELRRRFPGSTIHINTNGSRPAALRRLIAAGINSCRVSVFSFRQDLFAAYYRPRGYSIEEVLECARAARQGGAQLTVNLLTFPGVSDSPSEVALTLRVLRELQVEQLQLRSLNVDPHWLLSRLPDLDPGLGLDLMVRRLRRQLPGLRLGNFTRPLATATSG